MTDKDRWQFVNGLIQQATYLRETLPVTTQAACSCDNRGHCAHHAAVDGRLEEAIDYLRLAASQLRYPNGTGDRPAF